MTLLFVASEVTEETDINFGGLSEESDGNEQGRLLTVEQILGLEQLKEAIPVILVPSFTEIVSKLLLDDDASTIMLFPPGEALLLLPLVLLLLGGLTEEMEVGGIVDVVDTVELEQIELEAVKVDGLLPPMTEEAVVATDDIPADFFFRNPNNFFLLL